MVTTDGAEDKLCAGARTDIRYVPVVGHDPCILVEREKMPVDPVCTAGPKHSCGTYSNDVKSIPGSCADCYYSSGEGNTGYDVPCRTT